MKDNKMKDNLMFDNVAWWLFPETIQQDDSIETAERLRTAHATHAFVYLGVPGGDKNLSAAEQHERRGNLIEACASAGIQAHGCFCSMARTGQPESWHQRFDNGERGDLLCPANPEVQDWVLGQLHYFLKEYPLAGINLEDSYIIQSTATYDPANQGEDEYKEMKTCYCEYCKEHAPQEAEDRRRYFEGALTGLVARISAEVKDKRSLAMSAAARMPYDREFYLPYSDDIPYLDGWKYCQANKNFHANWADWHKQGLVDFVCPMSYLHDTRIVEIQTMGASSRVANPKENVWMGLGLDIMTAEYSSSKKPEDANDSANTRKQLEMLAGMGQRNVVFFAYLKEWVPDDTIEMMTRIFQASH